MFGGFESMSLIDIKISTYGNSTELNFIYDLHGSMAYAGICRKVARTR